ncbi:chorismate mutase [Candidatus Izemoplasma sp. B36]|uniref:chorismate mutase n=1 Tax=Candidatus Izemoplasma sp. B36 TaxID=3242468 RepID=UPI0035574E82
MKELRNQIDIIDKSIQNLFLERMQIVKKVALHKKENNLPIFDDEREKEIIKKNIESIDNLELVDLYKEFYVKMLEISKIYQERIIED